LRTPIRIGFSSANPRLVVPKNRPAAATATMMRAFIAIIPISSQIAGELEPPLEFAERSLHRAMKRGDGDRRNGRRLVGI
jgi:hypothetical protein